jgi:hypothetical protein
VTVSCFDDLEIESAFWHRNPDLCENLQLLSTQPDDPHADRAFPHFDILPAHRLGPRAPGKSNALYLSSPSASGSGVRHWSSRRHEFSNYVLTYFIAGRKQPPRNNNYLFIGLLNGRPGITVLDSSSRESPRPRAHVEKLL